MSNPLPPTDKSAPSAVLDEGKPSLSHSRWRDLILAFRNSINSIGIGFMVILGLAWEGLIRADILVYRNLPPPSRIIHAAGNLITSGELLDAALHTVGVALLGWVCGATVGFLSGVILGISEAVWRWTMASVEFFRSIPAISLVPISVLLFGFSIQMELVLVIFASQWPVMVSTIGGIRGTSNQLADVGRTLNLNRREFFWKIVLPSAGPSIIVGLRLALGLALILAVAAEILGNPAGLGRALVFEQQALRPDRMFVFFIAVGMIGILLNSAFLGSIRRCLPGIASLSERRASS